MHAVCTIYEPEQIHSAKRISWGRQQSNVKVWSAQAEASSRIFCRSSSLLFDENKDLRGDTGTVLIPVLYLHKPSFIFDTQFNKGPVWTTEMGYHYWLEVFCLFDRSILNWPWCYRSLSYLWPMWIIVPAGKRLLRGRQRLRPHLHLQHGMCVCTRTNKRMRAKVNCDLNQNNNP